MATHVIFPTPLLVVLLDLPLMPARVAPPALAAFLLPLDAFASAVFFPLDLLALASLLPLPLELEFSALPPVREKNDLISFMATFLTLCVGNAMSLKLRRTICVDYHMKHLLSDSIEKWRVFFMKVVGLDRVTFFKGRV